MSHISEGILILIAVICVLGIFALVYFIAVMRRMLIVSKKVDYLIEDFTYKAEMLNPAIETISRLSGYVDAFEIVTKRNISSTVKYLSKNRDVIYKMTDKIRDFANNMTKEKKRGK